MHFFGLVGQRKTHPCGWASFIRPRPQDRSRTARPGSRLQARQCSRRSTGCWGSWFQTLQVLSVPCLLTAIIIHALRVSASEKPNYFRIKLFLFSQVFSI